MKTMGRANRDSARRSRTSKPLNPASWISRTRQSMVSRLLAASNSSPDPKVCTSKPAAARSRRSARRMEASSSTTPITFRIDSSRRPFHRGSRRTDAPRPGSGSRQSELLGHPDEIGDGARLHLLHDAAPVDLDRLLGDAEIPRDLLVELAGDDVEENLALARGEGVEAVLELLSLRALGPLLAAPRQPSL